MNYNGGNLVKDTNFFDVFCPYPFKLFKDTISPLSNNLEYESKSFALDVIQEETRYVVAVDLPAGIKSSDIKASFDNGVLTISAHRETNKNVEPTDEESKTKYMLRERKSTFNMHRSIKFNEPLELSSKPATIKEGVLTITLDRVKPQEKVIQIEHIE
jgi:HSP20 family molecular chaperone IbpA